MAYNPRITDDAIPAFLFMNKLFYLSLLDTSITMAGVRRLAVVLEETGHVMEVEVPQPCEAYITSMFTEHIVIFAHTDSRPLSLQEIASRYRINLPAPLITEPHAVDVLSSAALKRNLSAHAEINADISTTGSKTELAERLRHILETRKADLIAQKLVFQLDDDEE